MIGANEYLVGSENRESLIQIPSRLHQTHPRILQGHAGLLRELDSEVLLGLLLGTDDLLRGNGR